jgi:hypothetical protein
MPSWRPGRQSALAAIIPIATAPASNEQAAVILGEEHVFVVGRVNSQRVPVLAPAVFQLFPATLRQREVRRSSSSESFVDAVRSNTPSKLVPA